MAFVTRPQLVACCAALGLLAGAALAREPQWGDPAEAGAAPLAAAVLAQATPAAAAEAALPQREPAPERPQLAALPQLLNLPSLLPLGGTAAPAEGAMALGDAALQALAGNPEVQAARWREESFAETRNAARGALLPKLELRMARGRGHLGSNDPPLTLARADNSAVLSQAVFDEPARQEWNRQSLLAASAEAQRAGVESTAMLDGGSAFLSALQARITLALAADYEQLLQELLRYISERAAAGGTSPAERDRVSARVANVRSSLADSRAALAAALRNLQRLTGATPPALALDRVALLPLPADADDALAQARGANFDLRAARIEQQAAEAERRGHRGRFLPRVGVELSQTRSANASGTESYTRDTKAMAVITLPLVNGGSDWAQMRAAEAHRNELEARQQATERKIVQDIETAYANLRASSERFASVKDELDGNRKVVEAFRAQLVGGSRPLLDVLDAYQRLHQSRLDLVQVLVGTTQNEWRIAHLTGRLRALAPAAQP